jgi:hypothetical protein
MNKLAIAQELAVLPDGIMIENRRQRITAQLGLASGLIVPLSGTELPPGEQRNYFYANAEEIQSVLYQINECIPFMVERSMEIGYRVWAQRHEQAFRPKALDLYEGGCVRAITPEATELLLTAADVERGVALIREGLAV